MSKFNLSCLLEEFQKLADVTLKTEDGSTFKTHKVILAQSSKYFRRLFGDYPQCSQTFVPMVKGEVLQQILLYVFQKDDILTEENVADVILAANYLIMDELVASCKSFIFNRGCTIHNCIQIYDSARQIEMKDVKNKCRRFIQIHAAEVFINSKNLIIDLSLDSFKEILECDNLNIREETMVWEIIMLWIKGSISDRRVYFPELLKYIRFSELDQSKLLDSSFCDINQSILGPGSVINQTKNLISLMTSQRSPRIPNRIYLICKETRGKNVEMHITYDERLDYSYFVGELHNKYYMPCNIVEQFVYFFCYYSGRKIEVFDLILKTWLPVRKFPLKYRGYQVVSANGSIYILGGRTFSSWDVSLSDEDNEENNNFIEDSFDDSSVEKMDETGEYPEIKESESDGITVDRENNMIIYNNSNDMTEEDEKQINDMLADFDPETLVNIVLRYNRETDSWRLMSPMIPVSVLNAVVLNNNIFVIGNSKDFDEQVCQVYNTITDTWTTISNPSFYRWSYCTTAVFNGNLYLIGGQDRNRLEIGKVEEYSPATDLWRTLPDLPSVYYSPATFIMNNTLIVYDKGRCNFWENNQFKGNPRSVFWDSEKEIWCDANFIKKDLLTELRFYRIYPMDDINVLKELTEKHKREESVWRKSALTDLDLDDLTIEH